VPGPLCMLGAPEILLAIDGLWFVLVGISRWDFHPFDTFLFLIPLALFSPIFVYALFGSLLLFGLLLLLAQLLGLSFQSEDLFFLRRRGIPGLGLAHGFELVVCLEHEGISVDVDSFLVFILLFVNVGDKFLFQDGLVCLEEFARRSWVVSPWLSRS